MMEQRSDADILVRHVWRRRTTKSWRGHHANGVNDVMGDAVSLAIRSGLVFGQNDFSAWMQDFRGSHWFGVYAGGALGESFYTLAVSVGNLSACLAFESYAARPAFKDINGRRMAIGAALDWNDERCRVTSLAPTFIGMCSYKEAWGKILHRYRVSIEEWRAEMAERRKARKRAKKVLGIGD